MRAIASEAARAKCTYLATTLQPSSAGSPSTVAANIRKATAIKRARQERRAAPYRGARSYQRLQYGSDPKQRLLETPRPSSSQTGLHRAGILEHPLRSGCRPSSLESRGFPVRPLHSLRAHAFRISVRMARWIFEGFGNEFINSPIDGSGVFPSITCAIVAASFFIAANCSWEIASFIVRRLP